MGAVVHQSSMRPVSTYQVQRTGWVLTCSISACGLCLAVIALGRRGRQLLVSVAVAGFLAGVYLISQPMAQATFAALPGLAALLIISLIYWSMRRRYRRRVARAVGFARPGSSLVRPSAAGSGFRESMTQDPAPAPAVVPSSS